MNVAENAKNNDSVTETENSAQNYHHDISEEDNRTADEAIPCDFCEKTFKTLSVLRSHEREKHRAFSGSPIPQVDGLEDTGKTYVKFAFTSIYREEGIEDSLDKIK